jgi:hypothetical protein
MIVIIVLSALLAACGGGAASSDPAGVVKSAMTAITEKNFSKMSEFVCAAQKDKASQMFNPAGALASAGVDTQKILDAMTIKLENGVHQPHEAAARPKCR